MILKTSKVRGQFLDFLGSFPLQCRVDRSEMFTLSYHTLNFISVQFWLWWWHRLPVSVGKLRLSLSYKRGVVEGIQITLSKLVRLEFTVRVHGSVHFLLLLVNLWNFHSKCLFLILRTYTIRLLYTVVWVFMFKKWCIRPRPWFLNWKSIRIRVWETMLF